MFNPNNFFSTVSNVQNIKTQISHFEYWNENDNDVTASGYFPAILGLKAGDRIIVFSSTKTSEDEYLVGADGSLYLCGASKAIAEISAKLPEPPEVAGDYVIVCTVDNEGKATYAYEEKGE